MPQKKPLVVTFTKMNGAGNDFIVLDNRFLHFTGEELAAFALRFCPRRTGVGADGLLALCPPGEEEEAEGVHYRMRYRNADGSSAGLCGNGARCLARFARGAGIEGNAAANGSTGDSVELVFTAGASSSTRYRATVPADPSAPVRFYAAAPRGFEPRVALRTDGLAEALPGPVAFVNTGTEHAVVFVERVAEVAVDEWGAALRRDAAFAPAGSNANFAEVRAEGNAETETRLAVRTFEKGVEDETLACGTGALAAAVVAWRTGRVRATRVAVEMPGGLLRVGFRAEGEPEGGHATGSDATGNTGRRAAIEDLYLEGPAETVFRGTVDVWL